MRIEHPQADAIGTAVQKEMDGTGAGRCVQRPLLMLACGDLRYAERFPESRVHARIEASRDKFTLIDESTNGTFVQTNAGEEIFVRRDSTQLTGEGVIGLGRVAQPGTALAVHFVVEE